MKKMIGFVVLASALAFAGCKKKEEKTEAAKPTEASGSAAPAAASGSAAAGSAAASGSAAPADPAAASGSAAPADPAAGGAAAVATGSAECDEYLKTFDDVVAKCKDKMGPALDAMKQSRDAMAEGFKSWGAMDEASKKATMEAAATGCKAGTDAIKQSATAMGCTL